MDRRTDETDVIVEEYEEIIGDLGEFSDQVEIGRRSIIKRAVSIKEPTSGSEEAAGAEDKYAV